MKSATAQPEVTQYDQHSVIVSLIIKGASRTQVESIICQRLNDWLLEDLPIDPPYPNGSLLHWSIRNDMEPVSRPITVRFAPNGWDKVETAHD